jgi:glycerate dehydrogenase
MRPRLIVLDGFTLTPNEPARLHDAAEPTWDALGELADVEVYPRTAGPQIVQRVGDAPLVLTNKTPIDAAMIRACPTMRYIGVLATGTNVIDLRAAADAGVTVTNVPGYGTASVAQHVFALLLELANRVGAHDAAVRAGEWASSSDFCFTVAPLTELAGKSLGIVGLGDIGRQVARIGDAMDMRVLAHSRSRRDIGVPATWLGLDELFAQADVVTLHCPLTDATRHMVNAARLATMKPTAVLINTGRGPLVDEAALAETLRIGGIAGAAVDVLTTEPPKSGSPLIGLDNCIVTPHVAWATREARTRMMQIVTDNVRAFMAGQPRNLVSA